MAALTTFQDINAVLALYEKRHRGEYSLTRMRRFMEFLGNPQDTYKIVHIAGTSGKTSTAHYIYNFLLKSGLQVGMSVSPHIYNVNERAQLNGYCLEEADYCKEFGRFIELVEQSKEKLIYFELLTAFAYWLFAQHKVDWAVIEVGMGGLLDPTNIIQRRDKIAVITDIGIDHTSVLGNTIEEIAAQKAGIILPHNTVFFQDQSSVVQKIIEKTAERTNSKLRIVDADLDNLAINIQKLPLFQQRNLHLAYEVCNYIKPISKKVMQQVSQTYIPARMESIRHNQHTIIIDGSHNTQKIQSLVASFRSEYNSLKVPILVSFGENKRHDVKSMLAELLKIASSIVLTEFSYQHSSRHAAINTSELAQLCKELSFTNVHEENNPAKAFTFLQDITSTVALVTGSYYLVERLGIQDN